MNRVVQRLRPFQQTIFATMTEKALQYDAVNLGQGFPDENGPQAMLERAAEEILHGNNQYGDGRGHSKLREAISRQRHRQHHQNYDPNTEILVTVGATEAISAAVLGLVEPGSEVILIEPYYDVYAAAVALADATRVAVPLVPQGNSWTLDVDALERAVTENTSMVILNTPHNPTGAVLSRDILARLADVCVRHDLLVLSDEVYEYLLFNGHEHCSIASLPGMRERTVVISSAAKTLNVTGWKTGWALAPQELLAGVVKAKQFLSYVGATPLQPAVAYALDNETDWVGGLVESLDERREHLAQGLVDAGFDVHDTNGTYFIVVDIAPLGYHDGVDFCTDLPRRCGVAAIPLQVFCDHDEAWRTKVRFAFCKQNDVLDEAIERLRTLGKKN